MIALVKGNNEKTHFLSEPSVFNKPIQSSMFKLGKYSKLVQREKFLFSVGLLESTSRRGADVCPDGEESSDPPGSGLQTQTEPNWL